MVRGRYGAMVIGFKGVSGFGSQGVRLVGRSGLWTVGHVGLRTVWRRCLCSGVMVLESKGSSASESECIKVLGYESRLVFGCCCSALRPAGAMVLRSAGL